MNNPSYMSSSPVLRPPPAPSLVSFWSCTTEGCRMPRQWHGSDNELLIWKDAECPACICNASCLLPRALLMWLPVDGLCTEVALRCLCIIFFPSSFFSFYNRHCLKEKCLTRRTPLIKKKKTVYHQKPSSNLKLMLMLVFINICAWFLCHSSSCAGRQNLETFCFNLDGALTVDWRECTTISFSFSS